LITILICNNTICIYHIDIGTSINKKKIKKEIFCLILFLKPFPLLLRKPRHHQVVRIGDPLFDQLLRQVVLHAYRVPVFLVHVVTGNHNFRVLLSKLNCFHRVAFQVDALKLIDVANGEYFAHYLETKRVFVKR